MAKTGGEHILVVDDEQGVRDSLRMVLEYEGFHVSLAAGGEKCMEAIGAGAPPVDLVLLDIKMPGKDGLQVLEEIKAAHREIEVNRDFQNMVTEYCWGGSWGRGVLSKQQRSILNLGMLAALNRPHEFRLHLLGALTNGVGLDEIREVLIQIAIYCGIPAGVEAFRIAREVFQEEGIDVSSMDSEGADE